MSTALAIAGVTAVLRDLLADGLAARNVAGVLGASVGVSVLAPDRVVAANAAEASQLNLFLYLATPNPGWRNAALPSLDGSGRARLTDPPLALDLHYLLSAYSGGDLHAEVLLGHAMQLLHETPVLSRAAVRAALTPPPGPGNALADALAEAGLAEQIELVKITPAVQNAEEMSKLWTATQSHLRPSAAYTVSVVLIQARAPARSALPVLTRGPRDAAGRETGIAVQPGLAAAVPLLATAEPPDGQPVAGIGDLVVLRGQALDGADRRVLLANDAWEVALELPAEPEQLPGHPAATTVAFSLAGQEAALPVGIYRVSLLVTRPDVLDQPRRLQSNRLALAVAPRLTDLPQTVARGGDGAATVTLAFAPALRSGQHATLVLGSAEIAPLAAGATPGSLSFRIAGAEPGTHLARLRVDGIESPIVNMDFTPGEAPRFLPRTVTIT
ncbi:Pvc16 family protein [Pseudorhodoferax sp.]|uniref:Pvc16 family protein n=1 Tax=Pseudorhodoferax sp. TaxID=1993553 RepID=UPI0039E50B3F